MDSLAFAVGVPATYVQAPKAKGRRNRTLFGFPTPRSRVLRAVCGGAPQMFLPNSFEEIQVISAWHGENRRLPAKQSSVLAGIPRAQGGIPLHISPFQPRVALNTDSTDICAAGNDAGWFGTSVFDHPRASTRREHWPHLIHRRS
jgi:hypothetical protein